MSSESTPTPELPKDLAPVPLPPKRTWRQWFRRAALIYVVLPYVIILVVMTFAQRSLIYRPTKTPRLAAQTAAAAQTEAAGQTKVDDVTLTTDDGLTLNGWHFHARGDTEPKFLVLYFPGNAGCRSHRVGDCNDFTTLSCDVVLFDYRGYGDNGGSPAEEPIAADARRVWKLATEELKFPPERIVLFGESLGGAVATRLAVEQSLAGSPPAALVLNSAFASLGETVSWHYPVFPFQFLLMDRYPSVDRIPKLTCPYLHFHGTDDDIVAYAHGRHLFDAAPAKSPSGIEKRFITIQGGQHNFISMIDMGNAVADLFTQISNPSNLSEPVDGEIRQKEQSGTE